MKTLAAGPLYYEFNRQHPVRLEIVSGDTIEVEAEDALSGQIRTDDDRRDKDSMPYSNPLTGPIFVADSEPGDTLAVQIHEIRPLIPQCSTPTSTPHQLCYGL